MTKRFGKEKDHKKIIKVTVTYLNRKYVEAKVVDLDTTVETKDLDVKLGPKVEIVINV